MSLRNFPQTLTMCTYQTCHCVNAPPNDGWAAQRHIGFLEPLGMVHMEAEMLSLFVKSSNELEWNPNVREIAK
jgi:hypothetical protein